MDVDLPTLPTLPPMWMVENSSRTCREPSTQLSAVFGTKLNFMAEALLASAKEREKCDMPAARIMAFESAQIDKLWKPNLLAD